MKTRQSCCAEHYIYYFSVFPDRDIEDFIQCVCMCKEQRGQNVEVSFTITFRKQQCPTFKHQCTLNETT